MIGYEDYKAKIDELNTKLIFAEQKIAMARQSLPKNARIKAFWVFGLIFFAFILCFVTMIVVPGSNTMPSTLAATGAIALIYAVYRFVINFQNRKMIEKELAERKEYEDIYKNLVYQRAGLFKEFVENNGGRIFYSVSGAMDYGVMREGGEVVMANLSNGLQLERVDVETIAYVERDNTDNRPERADGVADKAYIVFKSGNLMEFTERAYQFLVELLSDVDMTANRQALAEINNTYRGTLKDINIA
ncbi:MAG: hypothetical protein EOM87_09110 [Clostridia bacterium]|nr:hypothetical protein [Clostridia bacterium]